MRALRNLIELLGTAGVLGIGVLLFCGLFYFSGVRPLEREVEAQKTAAERLKTRSPVQLVTTRDRAEELRRFYTLFPTVDQLPKELDRMYAIARAADLQVHQGEYRLEARGNGLVAYRVTFPIRGTYGQIREFIGTTLKDISIASLDALRFERKKAGDPHLEAQLRFTIHFRPDGDEAPRSQGETEEAR